MKIKYLKNAPLAEAGDVADVPENEARILIILGIAEPVKNEVKRKKTTEEN